MIVRSTIGFVVLACYWLKRRQGDVDPLIRSGRWGAILSSYTGSFLNLHFTDQAERVVSRFGFGLCSRCPYVPLVELLAMPQCDQTRLLRPDDTCTLSGPGRPVSSGPLLLSSAVFISVSGSVLRTSPKGR